jgi:uncharacterized protein (TIGR02217 family)
MAYIYFPNPTPIFPALASVGWSVLKKPIMSSRVVISATGIETQFATAAFPRWAFTLTYNWLRDQTQNIVPDQTLMGFQEFQAISSLFLACKGSYGEFYFEDPDDNSRLNQDVGVGDGANTVFPLFFSWGTTFGSYTPVGGIKSLDAVYLNGVLQSAGSYLLSNDTTLIFGAAPAPNVLVTSDFHFYFRCRFLDDHLDFSQIMPNRWEAKEIRFESVKP